MKSVVEVADRVTVATAAGAGAAIVAVAAPVCPSLAAMIDAEPDATAVICPVELTVATSGFALDHVTDLPVSTLPAASRSVAVAWEDCPTANDDEESATEIDATGSGGGSVVVSWAVAVMPSANAVMVVVPALTPLASPAAETVAMAGFADDQATTRFASTAPLASRTVAMNRDVSPTSTNAVAGESCTLAAGVAVTVMDAVASKPFADARMVVVPTSTPVTAPVELTTATAAFSVDHVTVPIGTTLPFASRAEADS